MKFKLITVLILGYINLLNGHMPVSIPAAPWYSDVYNSYNEIDLHSAYLYKDEHPCKRECIAGQAMTCYYEFVVHYYETASRICALYNDDPNKGCILCDGVATGIMAVNRQIAGPMIEVCENDTVVVDVLNNLREGTTVHWHGLFQKDTPHMDGSPYTTQYPINAGESFRYEFYTKQHGSYWWHSHMNFQRSYGIGGPFIIRQPAELNPHAHMYDHDYSEHTLYLQDWYYNYTMSTPTNILINGKGHNNKTQFAKKPENEYINYERIKVVQGERYRFRIIYNGNANCPLQLSIDNHVMQVIGSDATSLEPVSVKTIILLAAERYDFVLYASEPVDNYWLRVKGLGFCEAGEIHQGAVLHYDTAPKFGLPKKKLTYGFDVKGLQLNPVDVGPSDDPNQLTLVEMNALTYTEWESNTKFKTYYTKLGLFNGGGFFGFQMDDIYFEMPPVSLLQTRFLDIEPLFCNKTSLRKQGKNCKTELCRCFNVIQVPAYEHIEFIIYTDLARGHPFHPHGIDFRVVGMGVLGPNDIQRIEEIDRQTPFKRRLDRSPAIKDTVQVPGNGYTIIRFFSDNPGYWMFHCHLEVHSDDGMMAILKIGDDHQMVPTPRNNCKDNTKLRQAMK